MNIKDILRWLTTGKVLTSHEKISRAAKKGHESAQCALGLCYYNGDGVHQDRTEAIRWLRRAARQGNSHAQFHLGHAHIAGKGVLKDREYAYAWFKQASSQGHKKSAEWLPVIRQDMTSEEIAEGDWLVQEINPEPESLMKQNESPKMLVVIAGVTSIFRTT